MVWDYAHFQERLASGNTIWRLWGRKLSPDDRLRIAHELRHEEKPERIAACLSIFTTAKYPLEIEDLLKYAAGVTSHDEKSQAEATEALKFFQDDRVRELVLRNLQAKIHVLESVEALAENFREEDCGLLEIMLSQMTDKDAFHSAGLSLVPIFEKNPSPKALDFLSNIYKHGYCSQCRRYAIASMITNRLLPDWIAQEAVWDCDADTRTAVREYLARSKK